MADLTQRFIVLGQTSVEEGAIVEASCVEVSRRVNDLALRLLKARSFIHFTLSLEYGPANEPQLAFHRLQAEVARKEKVLRVATVEVGTLQTLLNTERQGWTSSPSM